MTRSEAGGHLPPVLGALSARVTAKRPDLESLRGHLVRVPRTLDVDIAEGSNRVWVHDPEMDLRGEGPFAFPTVVLTADELRAVRDGSSGDDDPCETGRDAVLDSHSEFPRKVSSRAEARSFKDRVSSALKAPGVIQKTTVGVAGSSGAVVQSAAVGDEVASSVEQLVTSSLTAENISAKKGCGRGIDASGADVAVQKSVRGRLGYFGGQRGAGAE